jgi:hypothetical protein
MERIGCPAVLLSEPFDDGWAPLRVAEQPGLGAREQASQGALSLWRLSALAEVKRATWREANWNRWRVFERY